MTLALSKTLVAGTPENIEDVQTMFNELVAYVNSISDASSLPGDVACQAHATVPDGWLLCDGALVSRATYAALFGVIGDDYGAGDGSTTFALPDLRDKVPVGASGTIALASSGGAKTVTLVGQNLPSHRHALGGYTPRRVGGAFGFKNPASGAGISTEKIPYTAIADTTDSINQTDVYGIATPVENMQPYVAMHWRIKT